MQNVYRRIAIGVMVAAMAMTVLPATASTGGSVQNSTDKLAPTIAEYAEQVRGNGLVHVSTDRGNVIIEAGDSSGEQMTLLDEGGEFRAVAIPINGKVHLQIFDPDEGLTALVLQETESEQFKLIEVAVQGLKPDSTTTLTSASSETEGHQSFQASSTTICSVAAYPVYKSGGMAVGAGEIYGCNKSALLRLRIWLRVWIVDGGPWHTVEYLDQTTFSTNFYTNALEDCRSTAWRSWNTQVIANMEAAEGSDSAVLHTASRSLACRALGT